MPWTASEPESLETKVNRIRLFRGNFDLGKEKEMTNKYKIEEYQTPNKTKCQKIDKRDSEVKYESSGVKKSVLNQTPNKEKENKKEAFVTFNQDRKSKV